MPAARIAWLNPLLVVAAAMAAGGPVEVQEGALEAVGTARQAERAREPIVVSEFERDVGGAHLHCFAAVVDLTAVEVLVTHAPESPPEGADALLTATDVWAEEVDADLAVNANFFAWKPQGHADIIGLSLTDGQVVSPAKQVDGRGDPAIVFRADGTAVCDYIERREAREFHDGVAGTGGGAKEADKRGTLLVDDGVSVASTALPQPEVRHPRTAAGVSADGKTLYLLVVDGRQPGWSDGATLFEMAELMIELGAHDAVNLDGGGSSAFVWRKEDGSVFTNRPSDKTGFRKVANHLGVRVKTGAGQAGAAADKDGAAPQAE